MVDRITNNGKASKTRQVWAFSAWDGWTRVDAPYPAGEDAEMAMSEVGYSLLQTWPTEDNTIFVELREKEGAGWLVGFSTLHSWHPIVIDDLPSLLSLLGKLLPLVKTADALDAIQGRHEDAKEERRAAEHERRQRERVDR